MFYRVRANLHFINPDEAKDFFHDCRLALAKADTINPDQPNIERGSISWEKCYHDEDPTLPCDLIESYDTP